MYTALGMLFLGLGLILILVAPSLKGKTIPVPLPEKGATWDETCANWLMFIMLISALITLPILLAMLLTKALGYQ